MAAIGGCDVLCGGISPKAVAKFAIGMAAVVLMEFMAVAFAVVLMVLMVWFGVALVMMVLMVLVVDLVVG